MRFGPRAVLVVLAALLPVMFVSGTVLGGNGIGGVFNLGQANTVNKTTVLKGSTTAAQLRVVNDGSGPALDLRVSAPGTAPMVLDTDGTGRIQYLNADMVDGKHASEFVGGPGRIRSIGFGAGGSGGFYDIYTVADFWRFAYFCPDDVNTNGVVRLFNLSTGGEELFVDQGGTTPYHRHFPTLDGQDFAAFSGGEWTHLQIFSPIKGIADVDIFSVHRPGSDDCHIQLIDVTSGP